jgi:hypothetical protein
MSGKIHPIPLYTTSGDLGGFLLYPHLYNSQGEWIGWVTAEREVFSVFGKYVGWLSKDFRILRKRTLTNEHSQQTPPQPPPRFIPPARIPLPPLMAEISASTVDVLEERPDLLPTRDTFAFTDDVG